MTGRSARSLPARLRWTAGRMVPGHAVAVVRIAFGVVAVVSAVRILAHGWVAGLWTDPAVLLGWPGLPVPVASHALLTGIVAIVGLAGATIAAGLATRVSALVFLCAFGYLELLDRTTYLNHYWALTLLAVLLVALPLDGTWSLGCRRGPPAGVPQWAVWLLRAQVATIYLGAAVAKLDPDWLLRGQPLGTWLAARTDLPVVGPLLGLPGAGIVASWAGLLFDLTIIAWLWWRPTRVPAVAAVVAFHACTWLLFPAIGVFPVLMVGVATIWLPPDWPLAVRRWVARWCPASDPPRHAAQPRPVRRVGRTTLVLAALWVVVQVALPLRHLAIPGDVRWTEEGGRLSWRVMAEEKVGWATFVVEDPVTGTSQRVAATDVLTANQAHVAAVRPDLLHQLAQVLARRHAEATGVRPRVRVDARVSWNGRGNAALVDPTIDLAAQPWRRGRHQPWITEPPT